LDKAYQVIASIVGGIAFLIGWGYAIMTFGFFLGGGLGWIPALFIAVLAAALWPLLLLAAIGFFIFLYVLVR
jgi:hypothetical protein